MLSSPQVGPTLLLKARWYSCTHLGVVSYTVSTPSQHVIGSLAEEAN